MRMLLFLAENPGASDVGAALSGRAGTRCQIIDIKMKQGAG